MKITMHDERNGDITIEMGTRYRGELYRIFA